MEKWRNYWNETMRLSESEKMPSDDELREWIKEEVRAIAEMEPDDMIVAMKQIVG